MNGRSDNITYCAANSKKLYLCQTDWSFLFSKPNTFTVVLNQVPEDSEQDIVKKSVEAVDALGKMDAELQSRLGVKLTL